eukprot:CAMPEP_0170560728 /NCGR_PEP_ID=MMETSP0211-20121228/50613_1 /TAXON_ID=311385 /ORGANISM="Pseudokeronopsis sp., Strain OXSARD2" /LENGTH=68 /DNA_ID=CAMNT_0010875303 /DNA_START=64 /DNA_END=267 /DNA_ORIENTATION=+
MLKKDKSQTVVPSLLKTFKSKQVKVAAFAISVIFDSIEADQSQDSHLLRQVFQACQEILTNQTKEIRE